MNECAVRRCDFVFAQGINPADRYMAITVMPQKVREGCAGPTEVFARGSWFDCMKDVEALERSGKGKHKNCISNDSMHSNSSKHIETRVCVLVV